MNSDNQSGSNSNKPSAREAYLAALAAYGELSFNRDELARRLRAARRHLLAAHAALKAEGDSNAP